MRQHSEERFALAVVRLAVLLVLTVSMCTSAHAQTVGGLAGFCGFPSAATPLAAQIATGAAYASATVTNAPSVPTIPTLTQGSIIGMVVFVEGAPIRIRLDGAPTSLGGMQYGPGAPGGSAFVVCGSDVPAIDWVAASTTQGNATVHYQFYGIGR